MPGCPELTVIVKAFLWTSSRGKVATMLLLLCYSFYIFIYPCIYSYIFFYSDQVFTLAIQGEYFALCQHVYSFPVGSCVEPEGHASGPET